MKLLLIATAVLFALSYFQSIPSSSPLLAGIGCGVLFEILGVWLLLSTNKQNKELDMQLSALAKDSMPRMFETPEALKEFRLYSKVSGKQIIMV